MTDHYVNPNKAWQEHVVAPAGTPAPSSSPTAGPDAPAPPDNSENSSSPPTPPSKNLQPGAQGADVQALQNYLVQMGYLTPEQVSTGPGTYGPQTTAAVAKLQKDLGVNATTGKGYYGPQTQAAISQKYKSYFDSIKNKNVPDQAGAAKSQISNALSDQNAVSTDPVFGSMASAMAPIMNSLTQVLNNINNPALTAISLQQEYNDLQTKYGLPKMQADLLNMQNVMNGTEDDIRSEITKSGGFATDSQVMALTASRNKVILKQYNALSTQYQAAQTNVQNMMQYASEDRQTQLQRQTMTAGVLENMGSIYTQMMTMGMTMRQHATDNVNKIVTNIGYDGLAASTNGDMGLLKYYSGLLGVPLYDKEFIAGQKTLRQQTLADTQAQRDIVNQMSQERLAMAQQKFTIQVNSGAIDALTASRWAMASNRIVSNYIKNPQYQLLASASPYLARLEAAIQTPGSVSDQDLLDSYTKLNTGGGQVTEAQVNTVLKGRSLSDSIEIWKQKLSKGGVLSPQQRTDLMEISRAVYKNYQKQYQPVYEQATKQLSAAGIPDAYWTIPDLNSLSAAGTNSDVGSGSIFQGSYGTYYLPY